MRRPLLFAAGGLIGLALGLGVAAWLDRPPRLDEDLRAVIEIRQPLADVGEGLDAAWQRHISTHLARIRLRPQLDKTVRDIDVRQTEWFERFESMDARVRALDDHLHVEQIPGTSLIEIWFDDVSSADARTVANAVTRTCLNEEMERTRSAQHDAVSRLRVEIHSLSREIEDLDQWLIGGVTLAEERRVDLVMTSLLMQRLQLEEEIRELTAGNPLIEVSIVKKAIDPQLKTGL